MAAAPVGFSWVNYDSASVVSKNEEDISIIKSHAMRVVHRQRHKHPRKLQNCPKKPKGKSLRPNAVSAKALTQQDDLFLYQPETDWESLAICQFMEDFIYPQLSPDIAYQFLNFLPDLCNKYSDSSCLTEAISAVALVRFANQNRAPDLDFRARKAYATALTLVNASMKDPLLQKSDQVLATLCLLTKYEIVSGDALSSGSWQSHERGQAALICQRGEEQLRTKVGGALFRLIYTRQCMNCIAQGQPPAMGLTSVCWQLAFPTVNLRRIMKFIAAVANLRYAACAHNAHASPVAPKEACRIAQDAVRLEKEMTSFINKIPSDMKYERVPNDLHSTKGFESTYFPNFINVFRDLQHASLFNIFWYGRIYVLQTILQYSRYQLSFEPEDVQSRLQDIVNQICESLPQYLGDKDCSKISITSKGGKSVAAHYLIWILAAALTVPGVPEAQREWISERLKTIGNVHGIRQALLFV